MPRHNTTSGHARMRVWRWPFQELLVLRRIQAPAATKRCVMAVHDDCHIEKLATILPQQRDMMSPRNLREYQSRGVSQRWYVITEKIRFHIIGTRNKNDKLKTAPCASLSIHDIKGTMRGLFLFTHTSKFLCRRHQPQTFHEEMGQQNY